MQSKQHVKSKWLLALGLALCVGFCAVPVLAKKPKAKAQVTKATKSWKQVKARLRKKKKVIVVDGTTVRGTRHVPKVLYFLGRSKVEYRNTRLKRSYLKKVIGSVSKKPF